MNAIQDLEQARDELVHAGRHGPSEESIKNFLKAVSWT